MVKTITSLPSTYNQSINITMNDRDLDIVARNAMILLIALVVDAFDEAVDCMLHVWYSAFIRKSDLDILQQRIRPLISSTCETLKHKAPDKVLSKKWIYGQRSLRLVLNKSSWDRLLSFMDVPEGLTMERAQKLRKEVCLAESRRDYLERHLLVQTPSGRIAKTRFREDGLLLPFGSPREEFHEPNP